MDKKLMESIAQAKEYIIKGEFKKCEKLLRQTMGDFPHEAAPHNLMGLLCEKKCDHLTAMKHFRAAWSLDPTYVPAVKNLEAFGQIFSEKVYFYDENDCVSINAVPKKRKAQEV
ncbi:MAG: hypothetical protein RSD39_00495, partial [Oscillospiraceae bacterium]